MNIIILGPQGSGKGTQAELLAKKYNLEHIDIGGTLRQVAKMETPLGRKIFEIQNISKTLVPNEILKKVLHLKISGLNREKGVIFDGLPRTLVQAKFLEDEMLAAGRKIDKVIHIKLQDAESLKRISRRWNCRKCKAILIMGKDVFKPTDRCPKCCGSPPHQFQDQSVTSNNDLVQGDKKNWCRGDIFQREDDTPEGVNKRLEIFKKETMPVAEYFDKKGILIEVDGSKNIQDVFKEINKNISDGYN